VYCLWIIVIHFQTIDRALYRPAIYHLQQAYEKCITAYLKEVKFNNTSEATVYDNIRKLGHDTEESTITLLKDFADLQIRAYKSQVNVHGLHIRPSSNFCSPLSLTGLGMVNALAEILQLGVISVLIAIAEIDNNCTC
jgi:hypothetical protein